MKIGILTFHCAHNYGAVLQTYALMNFCRSLGHEVYVIDYRPIYLTKVYDLFSLSHWIDHNPQKCIQKVINNIMYFSEQRKRYKAFATFINRLNLIPVKSLVESRLDCILIGSDQVWSTEIAGCFDKLFWGQFPKNGLKIISYAASCGRAIWNEAETLKVRSFLEQFDSISVREAELQNYLNQVIDKPVYCVLDPTLLVGEKVFDLISSSLVIPKKYVLTYEVAYMPRLHEYAHDIAKKLGAEVISLEAYPSYNKVISNPFRTASPNDFIALFKDASYVITNSFHGTSFSIIYKRNFYTLKFGTKTDERSESLLNLLSLSNRMISVGDVVDYNSIDYGCISGKVENAIISSKEFLLNSLNK